uniref:Uncharacterized protein n=1 Tax=Plectus sambesii TaxID=2011161 RepID=A0A914VP07_9BILA
MKQKKTERLSDWTCGRWAGAEGVPASDNGYLSGRRFVPVSAFFALRRRSMADGSGRRKLDQAGFCGPCRLDRIPVTRHPRFASITLSPSTNGRLHFDGTCQALCLPLPCAKRERGIHLFIGFWLTGCDVVVDSPLLVTIFFRNFIHPPDRLACICLSPLPCPPVHANHSPEFQ